MNSRTNRQHLETISQCFASASPPRIVRKLNDGSIDVIGEDGKHCRLYAQDAGIYLEFLVDTLDVRTSSITTEEAVLGRLATAEDDNDDILVFVTDYLGNPELPVRIVPNA